MEAADNNQSCLINFALSTLLFFCSGQSPKTTNSDSQGLLRRKNPPGTNPDVGAELNVVQVQVNRSIFYTFHVETFGTKVP